MFLVIETMERLLDEERGEGPIDALVDSIRQEVPRITFLLQSLSGAGWRFRVWILH
jgi:hypothetical protein